MNELHIAALFTMTMLSQECKRCYRHVSAQSVLSQRCARYVCALYTCNEKNWILRVQMLDKSSMNSNLLTLR